ncbi:chloramphenicol phosphotransferase [Devosia algicola]|uniref:Chloramphenicol phosphotransferase n=1 Tax=Devosia algicola TaxID=3026418 RepID=A0ABY7YKD6_9HYPH|nr:chloramphenicol phosphotransferase [Devosia algicola]WDR01713.1 chloramphenicol phosphotransferase [Devosia algicola]
MAVASGQIVILNGAPRAGKTSIARAVQNQLSGFWINLGVDAVNATLPRSLLPGIGLRPGGERPDLEPVLPNLFDALYQSIAAHARLGFNVVVDIGHHDDYTHSLHILPACARRLVGMPVLFIGVHCPLDTIMARRNSDPQDGFYASGDTVPPPVARWQVAVHQPGIYDLELDTSTLTPEASADIIGQTLARSVVHPTAFERLADS